MDVDGADQAAANLLRPYVSRMRRRDLDQLEQALGAAAEQDALRALEAAAEANRAAILDYLRQAFGAEFTLEEDPSFVPGHTDTVMAIATDPAGARYAVMADVDEECRITEIRSAVKVDEEAASASSADAG